MPRASGSGEGPGSNPLETPRVPPSGAPRAAHICLIGLRGAGKTTVGQALAERLRRPFHDLDELVLRRLGARSVRAVFEREGEVAWRQGETAALAAFLAAPLGPSILALGGGAVMVDRIAERLREAQRGGAVRVVLLDCDARIAAERLSLDPGDRTSLTGRGVVEELEELHRQRADRYRELADVTIDAAAGSATDVAASIARGL